MAWESKCKYWSQEENAELSIDISVTNFFIVKEMIQGNFKDTSVKLQVWSNSVEFQMC